MDEDLILYLKIAVVVVLIYFWIRGLLRTWQLQRFYRKLKKAVPISANSRKGDYISFSGVLTLPAMKTPVSKQSCSYWGLLVRAVFKTKQKKPGKGMQTHRPVIYKAESDSLPLLLSNAKQIVHVLIDNPLHFMVNMGSKKTKNSILPPKEAKPFIKPKYKSYEVDEYWLPEKAVLHLWAVVTDVNKNCFSVSSGTNPKVPTLLYHGSKKSVFRKFSLRLFVLSMLILWVPIAVFWLFTIEPQSMSDRHLLIAQAFILFVGYILYRVGRIHFVR